MSISNSSSSSSSIPSNILTTTQYQAQQAATAAQSTSMGQGAFLTLFTAQLQNQDPTQPTDNSDFVAQLAQFSQLEATTSMQQSMQSLVSTLGGNGLMNAASLIGKTVGVPNGTVAVSSGTVPQATVNLATGADNVTLNVYDSSGNLVNSQSYGAQAAGQMQLVWNGANSSGTTVPDGNYTYAVTAVTNGVSSSPTVTVQSQVTGVTSGTSGALSLTLANGQSLSMSSVTNVSE
jgi:flagellar basal-body rod modification protein FlgD